jgi:pimeloyl-ACP methyl ester carboxylesterase
MELPMNGLNWRPLLTLPMLILLSMSVSAQGQSDLPNSQRERFSNADVLYGWVANSRGEKLRTFITRPKNATTRVPLIFFVGWLSCDSMEYPNGAGKDGFGALMLRLIDDSGYATIRMDKPGVGESEGDCSKADFQSEIDGWKAAFDSIAKYDFIDPDRVFIFGLSNGGGFSPLVARNHPVRGYISGSSWGRTWYEHMLDLERLRLARVGKSPGEVNSSVKAFTDFYDLYLTKAMTPGQVMAQHQEWRGLWYDSPDGQYGRPAAFYQQLQALNLGELWQSVDAPVLVIRGTADTIMSRADSEAIAEIVNQAHPGRARYLEVEEMTHGFTVRGDFYGPLVPAVLNWMAEQLKSK